MASAIATKIGGEAFFDSIMDSVGEFFGSSPDVHIHNQQQAAAHGELFFYWHT